MKIITVKQFEETHPPTPPRTAESVGGYSNAGSSPGRDSDEVEFLEVRTAIPLRNVRDDQYKRIAAQIAANRSRTGR